MMKKTIDQKLFYRTKKAAFLCVFVLARSVYVSDVNSQSQASMYVVSF